MEIIKNRILAPTTILETTLGIPKNYQQECIDEIYRLGDSQGQTTNVKAIMTSWIIWEETTILNQLLDNILKVIEVYVVRDASIHQEPTLVVNLDNAWGAIYKKGHYTKSHDHLFSWPYSFVYYLINPGKAGTMFLIDEKYGEIEYAEGKENSLIKFEGYRTHSPPNTYGRTKRYTIAFDVV